VLLSGNGNYKSIQVGLWAENADSESKRWLNKWLSPYDDRAWVLCESRRYRGLTYPTIIAVKSDDVMRKIIANTPVMSKINSEKVNGGYILKISDKVH
jgi:hypothetical protein